MGKKFIHQQQKQQVIIEVIEVIFDNNTEIKILKANELSFKNMLIKKFSTIEVSKLVVLKNGLKRKFFLHDILSEKKKGKGKGEERVKIKFKKAQKKIQEVLTQLWI